MTSVSDQSAGGHFLPCGAVLNLLNEKDKYQTFDIRTSGLPAGAGIL